MLAAHRTSVGNMKRQHAERGAEVWDDRGSWRCEVQEARAKQDGRAEMRATERTRAATARAAEPERQRAAKRPSSARETAACTTYFYLHVPTEGYLSPLSLVYIPSYIRGRSMLLLISPQQSLDASRWRDPSPRLGTPVLELCELSVQPLVRQSRLLLLPSPLTPTALALAGEKGHMVDIQAVARCLHARVRAEPASKRPRPYGAYLGAARAHATQYSARRQMDGRQTGRLCGGVETASQHAFSCLKRIPSHLLYFLRCSRPRILPASLAQITLNV